MLCRGCWSSPCSSDRVQWRAARFHEELESCFCWLALKGRISLWRFWKSGDERCTRMDSEFLTTLEANFLNAHPSTIKLYADIHGPYRMNPHVISSTVTQPLKTTQHVQTQISRCKHNTHTTFPVLLSYPGLLCWFASVLAETAFLHLREQTTEVQPPVGVVTHPLTVTEIETKSRLRAAAGELAVTVDLIN